MERLTFLDSFGEYCYRIGDGVHKNEISKTLGAIEDILGPSYDLSRLKELVEADREGRVAMFPCKQNDVLWTFCTYPNKNVYSFCVTDISYLNEMMMLNTDKLSVINAEDVGKTVFLTREAAERSLEAHNED